MRIVIFGANGPTGRLLTKQSVDTGHETIAVTRHPDTFPLSGANLRVAEGDVLDPEAVGAVVPGSDAVLSALGVPFGKEPVEVYSRGARNILDAMRSSEVRRLVVVSSGAVTEEDEPTGGIVFNRVLQPYVMKRLGKTVYDDMRLMEEVVGANRARTRRALGDRPDVDIRADLGLGLILLGVLADGEAPSHERIRAEIVPRMLG